MNFLQQQVLHCTHWRTLRAFFITFLLLACLAAAGCDEGENVFSGGGGDGDGVDTDPPAAVSGPSVVFSQNAPLAAVLNLTTDEPTEIEVDVMSNEAQANSVSARAEDFTVHSDGFATVHAITLLGFRPNEPYTVHVTLRDEAGNETVLNDVNVVTDPLPVGFPPIQVESAPEFMEPGVTLLPVTGRGKNAGFNLLVIVDESGEVIWYYKTPGINISDVRRLSNGNLLFIDDNGRSRMVEIDMLGNTVHEWNTASAEAPNPGSITVGTERFHHEVFDMENGNFLVLSVEVRALENYPTSDSDPEAPLATGFVAGDVIVEFEPSTGGIVNEWHLLDILDPYRISYDSLIGFWNPAFPDIAQGTYDWAHANAVIHDPSDNSIIVSLRHQDAVVKFSRETGDLIWILGNHDNWNQEMFGEFLFNPVGGNFLWQYHQHSSDVTTDGRIILFDNGNYKASPFDEKLPAPQNFSRAVEYSIDEETKEIMQVWEYGEFTDESIYAPFLGDADPLPITGNVLITFGGIIKDESGLHSDVIGGNKGSVRIIEVTHTEPADKVFDLSIADSSPNVVDGWQVYRAERLPSLYP